jgi:hypothetical protein
MEETYLGDGLYVSLEAGMIKLRAPRFGGDHVVYLEPEVFSNLLTWYNHLTKGEEPRTS